MRRRRRSHTAIYDFSLKLEPGCSFKISFHTYGIHSCSIGAIYDKCNVCLRCYSHMLYQMYMHTLSSSQFLSGPFRCHTDVTEGLPGFMTSARSVLVDCSLGGLTYRVMRVSHACGVQSVRQSRLSCAKGASINTCWWLWVLAGGVAVCRA